MSIQIYSEMFYVLFSFVILNKNEINKLNLNWKFFLDTFLHNTHFNKKQPNKIQGQQYFPLELKISVNFYNGKNNTLVFNLFIVVEIINL